MIWIIPFLWIKHLKSKYRLMIKSSNENNTNNYSNEVNLNSGDTEFYSLFHAFSNSNYHDGHSGFENHHSGDFGHSGHDSGIECGGDSLDN